MPRRVAIRGAAGAAGSSRSSRRDPFDAVETLASLFVAVQRAATDLARERGWDVETRLCSAGQAFGLVSKIVLAACRAHEIPSPRIYPYARRSLDLAEHPTLPTAAAVYERVQDSGGIPGHLRPGGAAPGATPPAGHSPRP